VADIFPQESLLDYASRRALFARAGVVEYVAWQVGSPLPIWNRLAAGKFIEVASDADDLIRSLALPGFRLRVSAFRARNWHEVLGSIAEGVTSWEHHELQAGL
jgi:hypothetical protein